MAKTAGGGAGGGGGRGGISKLSESSAARMNKILSMSNSDLSKKLSSLSDSAYEEVTGQQSRGGDSLDAAVIGVRAAARGFSSAFERAMSVPVYNAMQQSIRESSLKNSFYTDVYNTYVKHGII